MPRHYKPAARPQETRDYAPRGAALEVFHHREPEVLLSGPAGTGKSRAAIEKIHLALMKYPNARALFLRKTLNSLTSTGLVTYREHVLHPRQNVRFFSGNKERPAQYEYPNGAAMVVGGLDNPTKIMSGEYDLIFVQEATEATVTDWESLLTRLRNRVIPYQQLIADCNPDAPHHWLKQRVDAGHTLMLECRHEDNPILFHPDGTLTAFGITYMRNLDSLTGVRLQRLRYGRWVAAEGIVYEEYDRAKHLIDEAPKCRRYIVAVDWGFTNAGVMSVWGIDGDGRMYLVHEVYQTRELMDWWLTQAVAIQKMYRPEVFVCDPAEPAFILQFRNKGLNAIAGFNEIRPGIEAVQRRLKPAGDGRPRIFLLRDALTERDEELAEKKQPYCIDHEMDSYVWPKDAAGRPRKEKPLDEHNHGLDTMRYAVAYVDHLGVKRVDGNRAAVSGPRQQLQRHSIIQR